MAAVEIVAKFKNTNGATSSASFLKVASSISSSQAVTAIKSYAPLREGELTSAVYKTVTDLDLNG